MSLLDASAVTAAANALVAAAVEVGIAGQGFSLQNGTYREGYDKLHTLYLQAKNAREEVEHRAAAVEPTDVSLRIDGITEGARVARDAVGGVGAESLRDALYFVENQLATLLTNMHDSYVTYTLTDQEAAFDLIGAAETP